MREYPAEFFQLMSTRLPNFAITRYSAIAKKTAEDAGCKG